MTTGAVVMMIVICGLVWGGFLAFLGLVWRIEKKKRSRGNSQAGTAGPRSSTL
jgi:hypothetical protein